MNVRNCTRCGRIYTYDGFRICSTCRREDEKDFKKVREYLYDYPGANISEVSEATGVDSNKIIDFLKQGRLEISDDSNLILQCENCGTSIKTGRFCDKCTSQLAKEIKEVTKERTPRPDYHTVQKEKEKFRIIDRYEKRK